jgi:hypothetical protein
MRTPCRSVLDGIGSYIFLVHGSFPFAMAGRNALLPWCKSSICPDFCKAKRLHSRDAIMHTFWYIGTNLARGNWCCEKATDTDRQQCCITHEEKTLHSIYYTTVAKEPHMSKCRR